MFSVSRCLWGLVFALTISMGCEPRTGEAKGTPRPDSLSRAERLEAALRVLAADSLQGRETGTPGSAKAADFIAGELEEIGLEPAFGGSYFQAVEVVRFVDERGRDRLGLGGVDISEGTEVQEELLDVNVGAILRGTDLAMAEEVVILSAHFDHVGVGPPRPGTAAEAEGDSIYNGADDDGTGVAAVLEIARSMMKDGPAERTVLFLLLTGEEKGILGTRAYLRDPPFPLERTAANLNIEMLGRPGPVYGGAGRGWLTGFERSTMGPILTDAGVPIYPDPFPDRGLFFRSDNIGFAMEGIPAHTVSSSDLHEDSHTPDDEVDRIDFGNVARVVEALIDAVRVLADGEAPMWEEGGRPESTGGMR